MNKNNNNWIIIGIVVLVAILLVCCLLAAAAAAVGWGADSAAYGPMTGMHHGPIGMRTWLGPALIIVLALLVLVLLVVIVALMVWARRSGQPATGTTRDVSRPPETEE